MRDELLYACYATSDFYARETGISMIGFFENNMDYQPSEFFILDYGISKQNKEKLDIIAHKYQKSITYLPAKRILEDIQQCLKLKDFRGSLATYSRAFIDKIMPDYVNRLLYIDSDTVVVGSVSELKTFNMGEACMAGCVMELPSTEIKDKKLVLYSRNSKYYGCGIVLFDLQNWRNKECYKKNVQLLNVKKKYPCADQTLINNALTEDCLCKLPRKYNYTTHLFSIPLEKQMLKKGAWNTNDEIEEIINKPSIVHYPGLASGRPWFVNCSSRRKNEYMYYRRMSPWANEPLDIPQTNDTSAQAKFAFLIHQLEVNPRLYIILRLLNNIRGLVGPLLRRLRVLPTLPPEGIE